MIANANSQILSIDREERATQWLQQVIDRMMPVEPDWWLRMECGQVAETVEFAYR